MRELGSWGQTYELDLSPNFRTQSTNEMPTTWPFPLRPSPPSHAGRQPSRPMSVTRPAGRLRASLPLGASCQRDSTTRRASAGQRAPQLTLSDPRFSPKCKFRSALRLLCRTAASPGGTRPVIRPAGRLRASLPVGELQRDPTTPRASAGARS